MADSKPSKSARKREHVALQALGEQLIALKESDLRTVPLDNSLLDAILDAQRIKARGALRRQKQLIGKLMSHVDPEPIRAALAMVGAESRQEKQLFATAERWRDRIGHEGNDAVEDFFATIGYSDDLLRQLLADLTTAPNQSIEKRMRRQVFRRVHHLLAAQPQDV